MDPLRRVPLLDPLDDTVVGYAHMDYTGSAPDAIRLRLDGDHIDWDATFAAYGHGGWARVHETEDLAGNAPASDIQLAHPDDVTIPARVLRARGSLSPSEAIAVYLCEDPDGPRLSQADASRAMDVDPRNLHKYLRRAEAKQGGE